MPVLADLPRTEVIFAPGLDPLGPLGAKPMSEAPFNPVAPALANAVRDATGVRVHARCRCGGIPVRDSQEASAGGALGPNRYGKAEVRVVRVARGAAAGGGDLHPGLERVHVAVRRPGRRQPARRQFPRAADRLAEEQGVRAGARSSAPSSSQRRSASSSAVVLRVVAGADHAGADRDRGVRLVANRGDRVLVRASGDLVRTTVVMLDAARGIGRVRDPRPGGAEHDGVGVLGVPKG